MLLASLLIGVGYDAYCISGYATKRIALNDQSQLRGPVERFQEAKSEPPPSFPAAYEKLLKKKPNLQSEFLSRSELQTTVAESVELEEEEQEKETEEEMKYVHSWVLILPPSRDIEEAIFIGRYSFSIPTEEPTTGKSFSKNQSSDYLGINSLWNTTNYWVNMTPDSPLAVTRQCLPSNGSFCLSI